jgi:phospholipase A2-like protein
MARRGSFAAFAAALLMTLLGLVGLAQPAAAAPADKPAVLSSFTQTSAASYGTFFAARGNQGAWAAYGFDWSTDKCSSSPDNPLGFPFANSCIRHDFGYRNYKAIGAFPANKARLDTMLLADLLRVCGRYSGITKSACSSLAHTYYEAVHVFGTVAVSQADLDRAAAILNSGRVAAA